MKQVIISPEAPAAIGPYSHGCSADRLIFTSGQLGIDGHTGNMPDGVEAQTHEAMKNLGLVLNAGGAGYEHIVKTTVYLKDIRDFTVVSSIYESYFPEKTYPARSCFQVVELPKGGLVEIECVAVKA